MKILEVIKEEDITVVEKDGYIEFTLTVPERWKTKYWKDKYAGEEIAPKHWYNIVQIVDDKVRIDSPITLEGLIKVTEIVRKIEKEREYKSDITSDIFESNFEYRLIVE